MKKPNSKTPLVKLIPLLVRGVAPAAATITFGLSPATTMSAPGDLDPSFGDLGRAAPIMDFDGIAWSAQPLGTDGTLIAGGQECISYYCSYYGLPEFSNFMGELSGDGALVPSFVADKLDIETLDTALLADGSIIAVGQGQVQSRAQLVVAKLSRSGTLDKSFGTDGMFRLNTALGKHKATSVTVDPDGRIVVAGVRDNPAAALVVRLESNGALDTSFGTGGTATLASGGPQYSHANVIGVGGGYRIGTSDCTIIALNAAGHTDSTFGPSGTGLVKPPPAGSLGCNSLVAQPDGGLLEVGSNGSHAYATRFLATGTADTSFSGGAIAAGLEEATAVAVAGDGSGSIVVAGRDPAGTPDAVVLRIQASGQLDTSFGRAGSTLIDLPTELGSYPVVRDLLWRADGGVLAAGGASVQFGDHPFAVRLLGNGGADVPGVVGASQPNVTTSEQSNEAIVKVRRTGGAAGTVSVAYKTVPAEPISSRATSGKDFTAVAGRLTWHDGDTAEQEIHVPIIADGIAEESEFFLVQLTDPAGGAGLGTRNATIEIQPDGSPYGMFSVYVDTLAVDEGTPAQVEVSRDYYTSGAVSVTLTPFGGTASAGSDFDPTPVTLSWADGEGGPKTATINVPADGMAEPRESFSVKLASPTGGALIGPRSTGEVSINASDKTSGGGGGGAFGALGLLLLGVAKLLQMVWGSVRRRLPNRA